MNSSVKSLLKILLLIGAFGIGMVKFCDCRWLFILEKEDCSPRLRRIDKEAVIQSSIEPSEFSSIKKRTKIVQNSPL